MSQEEFLGLVRYAILLLDSYTPGTPRGGDPEPIEPSHEIHKTICEIERRYDDKKLPAPGRELWYLMVDYSRKNDSRAFRYAFKLRRWLQRHYLERRKRKLKIPPKHRSKPMSYRKAAQLIGKGNSKDAAEWVSASVEDGNIKCEHLSKQMHVFDKRIFPTGPKSP